MKNSLSFLISISTLILTGCLTTTEQTTDQTNSSTNAPTTATWQATEVSSQDGFTVPECVVTDGAGNVFVSNIAPVEDVYWDDDGSGFISKLNENGTFGSLVWAGARRNSPIHSPKGMSILDGWLYVNDSTRVRRCKVDDPNTLEDTGISVGTKYNDLATDGTHLYISDMGKGIVLKVDPKTGDEQEIPAPEGVNGVTAHDGKLYAVSWTQHEVYELDPKGEAGPVSFGLADKFTNLDGIEVLDDGSFIISDFKGNKVDLLEADRKTLRTLIEIESPADIGIDRQKNLLYVPQFKKDKVVVFELQKQQ